MIEKLKQRLNTLAEKTSALAKKAEEEFEHLKLTEDQRNARYDICKACDKFNETTTQCNVCHCFMAMKTYLPYSSCPLKKWTAIVKE